MEKSQNPRPVSPKCGETRTGHPDSFPLLCRSFWGGRDRGFGGHLGGGYWSDLHRRENLFEAVEDFVAVDVLDDAVLRGYRGDVQGELVARSILVDVEV